MVIASNRDTIQINGSEGASISDIIEINRRGGGHRDIILI